MILLVNGKCKILKYKTVKSECKLYNLQVILISRLCS